MYPRTNYEMTKEDLEKILEACKPTRVMCLNGGTPLGGNQQENANSAWKALGEKLGFDYMTVRPIEGKGQRFFSAVPSETETQKEERMKKEGEEKRISEIAQLEKEIQERQIKLDNLKKEG